MAEYFDINAILMEDEKVPCVSTSEVIYMGPLCPSSKNEHLDVSSKMELPLWLVKAVNGTVLRLEVPKSFNESHRETVEADPTVVNLHDWCPYYYQFGLQLAGLEGLPQDEIRTTLSTAFARRYPSIMDLSHNSVSDDTSTQTRKLDVMERQLFHRGLACDREMSVWLGRQSHRLAMAVAADRPQAKRSKRQEE
eukprot:m.7286 g.7286  ORF g.7286 m.7286 type:complete len:194 (-) comp8783_c0_seq1:55-636(-)